MNELQIKEQVLISSTMLDSADGEMRIEASVRNDGDGNVKGVDKASLLVKDGEGFKHLCSFSMFEKFDKLYIGVSEVPAEAISDVAAFIGEFCNKIKLITINQ